MRAAHHRSNRIDGIALHSPLRRAGRAEGRERRHSPFLARGMLFYAVPDTTASTPPEHAARLDGTVEQAASVEHADLANVLL